MQAGQGSWKASAEIRFLATAVSLPRETDACPRFGLSRAHERAQTSEDGSADRFWFRKAAHPISRWPRSNHTPDGHPRATAPRSLIRPGRSRAAQRIRRSASLALLLQVALDPRPIHGRGEHVEVAIHAFTRQPPGLLGAYVLLVLPDGAVAGRIQRFAHSGFQR